MKKSILKASWQYGQPHKPMSTSQWDQLSVRLEELPAWDCRWSLYTAETTSREENVQDRGGCAWSTEVASAACVSLGRNTGGCYLWGLRVQLIRDGRVWKRLFLSRGRVPWPYIAVYRWRLASFSEVQYHPSSGCVSDQPHWLQQVRKDSRIMNTLITM